MMQFLSTFGKKLLSDGSKQFLSKVATEQLIPAGVGLLTDDLLKPKVNEAMESQKQERERESVRKSQASKRNDEGMALESFGRYEEALKAIDEAILLDPKNAVYHYTRATRLKNRLCCKNF